MNSLENFSISLRSTDGPNARSIGGGGYRGRGQEPGSPCSGARAQAIRLTRPRAAGPAALGTSYGRMACPTVRVQVYGRRAGNVTVTSAPWRRLSVRSID